MSTKTVRAVVSVAAIGGALSVLLFFLMSGGADYYKMVDEVAKDPQQWYGKGMNLHGFVEDLQKKPNTLDYQFKVKTGDAVLLASYTGVVPDTFQEGAEVVLTGKLAADGFHVVPNGVTAKCPSKYTPTNGAVATNGSPAQSAAASLSTK